MVKLTLKGTKGSAQHGKTDGTIRNSNLISFHSDLSIAHQVFTSLIRFACNCSEFQAKSHHHISSEIDMYLLVIFLVNARLDKLRGRT